MTLPIVGRTAHKALIDDFGAILIDLKAVGDDIQKQLRQYARGDNPQGLTNAALDVSDLQSAVARLVKVHAEMVILVSNAKTGRVEAELTRLSDELANLRALVTEGCSEGADNE